MTWSETPKSLLNIFTNKKEGSIKEVKIETPSRPLTNGEIKLAISVFKNSINYTTVKIFFGSFFPLKSQNEDTFVTPNGSIYIMPKHYRDDYSLEDISYKKIFLHELGHVWQHQRKLIVLANAGPCRLVLFLVILNMILIYTIYGKTQLLLSLLNIKIRLKDF
ncbi:hypothetical protein Q5X75_11035 [Acinetobacter baumannii]|nr:hypothetical protein [Acinetobacter baumannii]